MYQYGVRNSIIHNVIKERSMSDSPFIARSLDDLKAELEKSLWEERHSLRDDVYEHLRKQMASGRLLPGSVINMDGLCAELGLSRTPLRDALIRLDAEGVVIIYPRSRIVVNTLTLEDIKCLYEVTGVIEASLISSYAERYTASVLDVMESYNQEMERSLDNDDIQLFEIHHYKFHNVMVNISRLTSAARILLPIKNRLWDFPKKSFQKRWFRASVEEHNILLQFMRSGKSDNAAVFLKQQHWNFEYNKEFIKRTYCGLCSDDM